LPQLDRAVNALTTDLHERELDKGAPEDFHDENFRRLLVNAIFWTTKNDPDKMKKWYILDMANRLQGTRDAPFRTRWPRIWCSALHHNSPTLELHRP
jgi:hypothetical protein